MRVAQTVQLELADGLIRGDGTDPLGPFTIDGEYRSEAGEVRMGWIKTYEGAHSILYLGVLRGDALAGEWSLGQGWDRGTFLLHAPDQPTEPR
jgi:hypothetical protein